MRVDFYKNLILIFVLSTFSCYTGNAQSGVRAAAINNTNTANDLLKEKIYVHTDQSFYVCGEVLWLKAYLTNAINHKPLGLSKVVYLDVLNELSQPVLQSKIAMDSGVGNGSLLLPFTIPSGNYVLRAYTSWMKNFSPGDFFMKKITIVNTTEEQKAPSLSKEPVHTVEFFPEGGNMVIDLESVIAFKIMDDRNKGMAAEGIVVDEANDTVAQFKTLQFGMGHFKLTPLHGKEYTAILALQNGSTIKKKLPQALSKGFVMHLDDRGSNSLELSVNSNLPQENHSEILVLFQNQDKITMALKQSIINNRAVLRVNKDSLMEGLTRITVFDVNRKPLSERLYFKQPINKVNIVARADKENYTTRSKVQIDLFASDVSGNTLQGNLSTAVFRLDDLHQPDQEGILSYLWLSSWLKGNIENPDYYFDAGNTDAMEAMNNLLMTQGWTTFSGENTMKIHAPLVKYMPELSAHFITGKITNKITGQPVADVPVYLSVPGRRVQLRTSISDSTGSVHFEMKDFFGPNQIVLQTQAENAHLYNIEIHSPYSLNNESTEKLPDFKIMESNDKDLLASNFNLSVQNTYHPFQADNFSIPAIDSLPFYFAPDKTYKLEDYKRFTTMEEVMREYVFEVNVRKRGSQFRFATLNLPGFALRDLQSIQTIFDNDPLVLLDGVPVFDVNKIVAYDPLKVQKLEVVAQKYHLGSLAAEGILSYTTYDGNLEGFTLDPNDLVLDYEGLQQQRIFYSPQYTTSGEINSRLPDFRSLLFWSPNIQTNETGKADFSFYTGDIPGKYMVVIQGLSANGYAGSSTFIFNVIK